VGLIDRTRELSVLTGLLEGAQAGNSAAIVLRGEPGIGKTALLEAVSGSADAQGMTTAVVTGKNRRPPSVTRHCTGCSGSFPARSTGCHPRSATRCAPLSGWSSGRRLIVSWSASVC
jgi:AAA ATPase domain